MLFVSGVAAYASVSLALSTLFCRGGEIRGANLHTALAVAFLGGLVCALLIGIAAHFSDYVLAAALVLSAAGVGVALAFVAADSATHIQDNRACDLLAPLYPLVPHQHVRYSPDAVHFGYLYVLWGIAIGLLCIQAGRVAAMPSASEGES